MLTAVRANSWYDAPWLLAIEWSGPWGLHQIFVHYIHRKFRFSDCVRFPKAVFMYEFFTVCKWKWVHRHWAWMRSLCWSHYVFSAMTIIHISLHLSQCFVKRVSYLFICLYKLCMGCEIIYPCLFHRLKKLCIIFVPFFFLPLVRRFISEARYWTQSHNKNWGLGKISYSYEMLMFGNNTV